MKNTKKIKAVKSSKAVKQIASKTLTKKVSQERERVLYNFDVKKHTIKASFAKTNKSVTITQAQVKELVSRLQDLKRFYSYCNVEIDLLRKLNADAQAKKQQLIKNTQYDSRKKLHKLLLQVSLTHMKQKSKAKRVVKARVKK